MTLGIFEDSNEPSGSVKCWEFLGNCTTAGISRRVHVHGVSYLMALAKSKNGARGRYYDTSRKVAGSRPDEALEFTKPLTEMCTRSKKFMSLGTRARPVRRTDNLTAICEPTV
jgi:hypothetical protein